mgnify:CR=1 FL=1
MPDINIQFPVGWVNVYAALGITVGTRLLLQNKDPAFDPLMREQATSPSTPDTSGTIAPYGLQYEVPSGAAGCWARGRLSGAEGGPGLFINVQVAP